MIINRLYNSNIVGDESLFASESLLGKNVVYVTAEDANTVTISDYHGDVKNTISKAVLRANEIRVMGDKLALSSALYCRYISGEWDVLVRAANRRFEKYLESGLIWKYREIIIEEGGFYLITNPTHFSVGDRKTIRMRLNLGRLLESWMYSPELLREKDMFGRDLHTLNVIMGGMCANIYLVRAWNPYTKKIDSTRSLLSFQEYIDIFRPLQTQDYYRCSFQQINALLDLIDVLESFQQYNKT